MARRIFYHNTTESNWRSIQSDGVILAGGRIVELSETEEMSRAHDVGFITCGDSRNCVCLSPFGNPRFGDVTIAVAVDEADCIFYSGDVWEPDTRKFDTLTEATKYCDSDGIDIDCIEIRHAGDVTEFYLARWDSSKRRYVRA